MHSRREQLFRRGAHALSCVRDDDTEQYACPPQLAGSVAVVFGWYLVLLPGITDTGFFDVLSRLEAGELRLTLDQQFSLGRKPRYALDG